MKLALSILPLALIGCTNDNDAGTYEADAVLGVKALVAEDIANLRDGAGAVQASAPAPDTDGWAADEDLTAARAAWRDTRVAYERIEGAIAVLFPDLDASTDERYDGFLAVGPDAYLFDGEGVTGVHGIERILWADSHPSWVVTFESGLTGYTAASFPANATEATDFRDALVQRLIDDGDAMDVQFEPLALDAAAAYEGVIGSMAEQVEKTSLAATGEDESRYAQHTLADMRANLAGGLAIYEQFSPWIVAQEGGESLDAEVRDGYARVGDVYTAISGDAIPTVPATWDPAAPSAEDLATPYGQLWAALREESDPALPGSLVERMVAAGALIDIEVVP